MIKHNQEGSASSILAILIAVLLMICLIIFGTWAYSGRQHYKNDTQSLINKAVSAAVLKESSVKDAQFAKEEQYPLATYNGPEDYGSLVIKYPRTWSGYVDTTGTTNLLVSYFNPGVIPSVTSQSSTFALSVEVVNQTYSQTLQNFQQQTGVTTNVYALPKLPKVVGVEISGPISQNQTDETMVILPLRNNTLEISTGGTQYLDSFNNIILPNLSFSP